MHQVHAVLVPTLPVKPLWRGRGAGEHCKAALLLLHKLLLTAVPAGGCHCRLGLPEVQGPVQLQQLPQGGQLCRVPYGS